MNYGTVVQEHLGRNFSAAIMHLEDFRATKDPESLHQYRVKMKKVFAVIRYLEKHHRITAVSMVHAEWKFFFKSCGLLREWQLYHQWLKRRGMPFSSAAYGMLGKIHRMEQKVISGIPRHIQSMENGFFRVEELLGHMEGSDQRRYLQRLMGKINQIFSGQKGTLVWHPLRRRLKDAIDVVQWIPAMEKKQLLTDRRAEDFRNLQSRIGEWHDSLLLDTWENSQYLKVKKPGAGLRAEHERIRVIITRRMARQEKNIQLLLRHYT